MGKLILNLFLALSLAIGSTVAYANQAPFANVVKDLNENNSLEDMHAALKAQFTTKEDHRLIDADIKKMKAPTLTWTWRYETSGDSMVFRVNGNAGVKIKVVDAEKNEYMVNGQKMILAPKMGYLAATTKINTILANEVVSLDKLFFTEAHAAVPFLLAFFGLGALVGMGKAAAQSIPANNLVIDDSLQPKIARRPVLRCLQTFPYETLLGPGAPYQMINGIPHTTWFKSDSSGVRQGKVPASGRKRLYQIAYNYVTGHHKFSNVAECVERKQHMAPRGWLFKEFSAQLHCQAGWDLCTACGGCGGAVIAPVVPVVQPVVAPQYNGKPQNAEAVVEEPVPAFSPKPQNQQQQQQTPIEPFVEN